jgi:hypothetical protein
LGTTARFGLRYPELTDAPNGPEQIRALAEDTDTRLSRAFRCTSSTRPTGVPNDFIIRESDTGSVLIWTGSAWAQIAGAVGGGGGGTGATGTVSATYAATAAQSVPNSTDTTIAFGVQLVADNAVTRSTSGPGHKFTLTQTRLWVITATLRFSQNSVGGRTFELRAGSTVLAKASAAINADGPYTACLAIARKLTSGTEITAVGRHNAGISLALEPAGGDYVHIDLAGV